MKSPRDVLADRISQWAGDSAVYDFADRLLKDLDTAGYEVVAREADVEARVDRLRSELRQAEADLKAAKIARAEFAVGDVVEAKFAGSSWEPAVVRGVDVSTFSTWYQVSFAKKNGEWSKAERQVFSDVRVPEDIA